jgi:hypothetical protein
MITSHVKRVPEERRISMANVEGMTGPAGETLQGARRGGGPEKPGSCTLLTLETAAGAHGITIKDLFDEELRRVSHVRTG